MNSDILDYIRRKSETLVVEDKSTIRAKLAEDQELFLSKGGEIQTYPSYISAGYNFVGKYLIRPTADLDQKIKDAQLRGRLEHER